MSEPGSNSGIFEGLGRHIAPPRFVMFIVLLPVGWFAYRAVTGNRDIADSGAMAFDLAALIFLISLAPLLRKSGAQVMRAHSAANDANRMWVLALSAILVFAVFAAIGGELEAARGHDMKAAAKLMSSLLLAWLFANSVFALHYAHAWYLQDDAQACDAGGLDFPETPEPDYIDFAYFAFTLGMTFQTSDVQITSRKMRRIVLFHTFGAFLFNIGVIAFAINALGG